MNIINFKKLNRSPLRQKALLIADAGYAAIDIKKSILSRIKLNNNKLIIDSNTFNLDKYKKIFVIGIGKGSASASLSLAKILGKKMTKCIALDVKKVKTGSNLLISDREFLVGTHPLPSAQNIFATKKIIKLVNDLDENDLLITFVCGGGSALLCGSEKELKYSQTVFKKLTEAGADILDLNTIRKHLSEVKAGGLAKMAYPATVISLIVSDVLGDNLSIIASGPTVFDETTKKDAEKILKKYLNKSVYSLVLLNALRESPKNKKYFRKVKNLLFLSNREAVLAMAKKAEELGFKSVIYSYLLRGEARNSLLLLAKKIRPGEAFMAGGETTVNFQDSKLKINDLNLGKGGRNMEAVLGALAGCQILNFKRQNTVFLSFASDGRDNTESAGAIGDILTLQNAKKMKLNPQEFLDSHDSFGFFKKTSDLIFVKKKTFNVADLMIVLKE